MPTTPPRTRAPKAASTPAEDPVPGDVLACLDELGVQIHRVIADEAEGRCPAHERRTGRADAHPSWSVNLETGQHNCFSCGFRGPFIVIVKEVLDHTDEQATTWIRARGSIARARRILGEDLPAPAPDEPEITEAHLALYTDPPTWACEDRMIAPHAAEEYGVLWRPQKARWIIPIRQPGGTLLGWQEKGHDGRYFRNRPRNIPKSTTLFGLDELLDEEAILVESPLDVLRIYTALGDTCAVSSFGASVSDAQLDALADAGVRDLVCALDNDRDGITQADALRRRVRGRFRLRYWDYAATDAKDPGDQGNDDIRRSYHHAYPAILWTR